MPGGEGLLGWYPRTELNARPSRATAESGTATALVDTKLRRSSSFDMVCEGGFGLRVIAGELWLASGVEGGVLVGEGCAGGAGTPSFSFSFSFSATTTTGGELGCWSISLSFRRISSSSCSHCTRCFFDFFVSFLGSVGRPSSRCKMSFLFFMRTSLSLSPSLTSLVMLPLLPVLARPVESPDRRDAGVDAGAVVFFSLERRDAGADAGALFCVPGGCTLGGCAAEGGVPEVCVLLR